MIIKTKDGKKLKITEEELQKLIDAGFPKKFLVDIVSKIDSSDIEKTLGRKVFSYSEIMSTGTKSNPDVNKYYD